MKVYIKSATNTSEIEAKIAKKQAEIDKKEAWIAKKEDAITKKLALLKGNIDDTEYDNLVAYLELLKNYNSHRLPDHAEVNTWALVRKYGWNFEDKYGSALYSITNDAESIYNSKYAIKEAQQVLDNYKSKLSALKAKADEVDRIPDCLKAFLDDIVSRWDAYDFNIRDNSPAYYRELKNVADEILYSGADSWNRWEVEKAKLAELYPDLPSSGWGMTRERKFKEEHIINPFEARFGSLKYAQGLWGQSDEWIHKQNQRDGENLILDLLKRVTKITGPVTDWSGLHITQGNMGAVLNGIVVGEEGKARVESIYASGPVQRLHIRTLVKEVK